MAANKGKMPVLVRSEETLALVNQSPEHVVLTNQTQLPMLADRIKIKNYGTISIGDIPLFIGALGFAAFGIFNILVLIFSTLYYIFLKCRTKYRGITSR